MSTQVLNGPGSAVETTIPPLHVRNLAVSFGAKRIFGGIDLDVAEGEAVSLIGGNGSGKSTLLRSIVRLVEPTEGSILIRGQDMLSLRGEGLRRARSGIGFVFQKHNLVPRLSALSNVLHGAQARANGPGVWFQSLASQQVRDEALTWLAAVGLLPQALQRVDSLSGGQSQRVAIARMLMQRPKLILVDEPDASLDPKTGREVMELLHRLAKARGVPILIVSHRLEHVKSYSDRIVGLAGGRVALNVDSDLADPASLRSFFEDAVS